MNTKRLQVGLENVRIYFETKSPACKGLFKFYLSLFMLVGLTTLVLFIIALLGKDIFPGDHTLYMISGSFFMGVVIILLTPSKEKYKSTSEKFKAYAEAKKYISWSYKIAVMEIIIRLISEAGDFWEDIYVLVGLVAMIMAFWFAISALIVFFINHEINSTHKICYEKIKLKFKKQDKEGNSKDTN